MRRNRTIGRSSAEARAISLREVLTASADRVDLEVRVDLAVEASEALGAAEPADDSQAADVGVPGAAVADSAQAVRTGALHLAMLAGAAGSTTATSHSSWTTRRWMRNRIR